MQRCLVLLIGLFLTVPASASALHEKSQPANFATIHMVTPLVGWGTNQTEVLHTSDGGQHWQKVTPAVPRDKNVSTGYFPLDVIDSYTAWLAAPNRVGATTPTALYLFHTSDGGRQWVGLPSLHLGQFGGPVQIQFADPLHGWIVVIREAGMSQISFDIYRTTDGGHHWWRTLEEEEIAGNHHHIGGGLPALDVGYTYTFASPTSGWVAGCFCGFGNRPELFFHSTDGGHTWHPYSLTLPPAFRPANASVGTPAFFSQQVAVLPVYLFRHGIKNPLLDTYHTVDGGRTWHGTTPVPLQGEQIPSAQFVDPLHGFVLDGRGLHRTADGGHTWRYSPFHFSRQDLLATDFVSPTTGFTLEGIGATERSRLYGTTDGGHTWHPLPTSLSG